MVRMATAAGAGTDGELVRSAGVSRGGRRDNGPIAATAASDDGRGEDCMVIPSSSSSSG